MHKFVITQLSAGMVVGLYFNQEKIGVATLTNCADVLRLVWIEVNDKHKGKGKGTLLMNYITDNILNENQNFQICVVDEEVLPFYYSFFEKRKIEKETIYDWVHDGDVHPEIYVPKGSLKNTPINKLKRSC